MASVFPMGVIALLAVSLSTANGGALLSKTLAAINLRGDANSTQAALANVVNGVNTFSTQFTKTIIQNEKSGFISSALSVWMVLGMMAFGASDQTLSQLNEHLGLKNDTNQMQLGIKNLLDNLNSHGKYKLRVVEKLFFRRGITYLNPEYTRILTSVFNAEPQTLNFRDPEGASSSINNWCAEQTANLIKEIISPGDLSVDTSLVFVNAVYFKGTWVNKFDKHYTRENVFRGTKGPSMVPFMSQTITCNWGKLPKLNAQFIELPYEGKAFSMFIVLPASNDDLADLEKNFEHVSVSRLIKNRAMTLVDIELPKFKLESQFELMDILNQMGLTKLLDEPTFGGISDQSQEIVKIVHKAVIEVTEKGTEAAAVTCTVYTDGIGDEPPPRVVFRANHTFYVMIATTGKNPVTIFTARYDGI